jgi:hypothetical protein
MNIHDSFPSRFFKCADLEAGEINLTIAGVKNSAVGVNQEVKPIVEFVKEPKALVLNKTNAMTLLKSFGSQTDGCVGKRITLYLGQTSYGPGIRVKESVPEEPVPAAFDALGDENKPF